MHHKFIDQYYRKDTYLGRRDPRIKLSVLGCFVCLVLLVPRQNAWGLVPYGAILLFFLIVSRLPLRVVLGRILAMLPFVALAAWSMFAAAQSDALPFLGIVLLKAAYILSAVFLTVATTPFPSFLKALEWMKCPSVMIRIFSFLYRYLYLLLDEFMMMRRAQAARTVKPITSPTLRLRIFSSMLAHLFIRSYEKGERIYLAMCARGYDGSVRVLSRLQANSSDYIFLVSSLVLFTTVEVLCRAL